MAPRQTGGDGPPRRKRRSTSTPSPAEGDDPLGKLIQMHGVTLAGMVVVCGTMWLIGAGVTAWAASRQPRPMLGLIIGGGIVFGGFVLMAINLMNVGRQLEIRKRGLRFHERGAVTELLWDDIVDVEIDRLDDTYLGIANVRQRSADSLRRSGPMTKTEWDVTIRGRDGRLIRLKPNFFRIMADPRSVVHEIRLRAGLS